MMPAIVDQISNIRIAMVKSKKIIHAVVAVVVDANTNKVLVSKRRAGQSYAGYWEFPGGKIEANETHLQALTRELKEELNISVDKAEFIANSKHNYPEFDVSLEVYKITAYSGIVEGHEGQDIVWCEISNLSKLEPLLPGSIELIGLI